MNVKLIQGLAGDRCAFAPLQVIECSERTGRSLVAAGIGEEAAKGAPVDGRLHDDPPAEETAARRPRAVETATKATPEAAVTAGAPARCKGKTVNGNACMKAPVRGSEFCAKHKP